MRDPKEETAAQRLSAMMDLGPKRDERDTQSVADESASVLLHRYHLIGALMRNETDGLTRRQTAGDLATAVAASIAHESTPVRNDAQSSDDAVDGVTPLSERLSASGRQAAERKRRQGWWPTVVTFALAASLVAVAVLVVDPVPDGIPTDDVVDTGDTRINNGDLDVEKLIAATPVGTRWSPIEATLANGAVATHLNMLLVEHASITQSPGMNGLTAFARFVSYDGNRKN